MNTIARLTRNRPWLERGKKSREFCNGTASLSSFLLGLLDRGRGQLDVPLRIGRFGIEQSSTKTGRDMTQI